MTSQRGGPIIKQEDAIVLFFKNISVFFFNQRKKLHLEETNQFLGLLSHFATSPEEKTLLECSILKDSVWKLEKKFLIEP